MTIGIGLLCTDGIVIGSDTREVWSNLTKRNTEKMHVRGFADDFNYVTAGAGSGDLIAMFNDELDDGTWKHADERLAGTREFVDVSDIARTAMKQAFDHHILPFASFPQDQRPEHSVLLGVQTFVTVQSIQGAFKQGSTSLYRIAPPYTLIEVSDRNVGGPHCAIGIGLFLADSLMERIHTEIVGVEATADLAVYILKHVKAVVQDCDGLSDVVLLRNNGAVEILDATYVTDLEDWYTGNDAMLAEMLHATVMPDRFQKPAALVDRLSRIMQKKPKQQRRNAYASIQRPKQ